MADIGRRAPTPPEAAKKKPTPTAPRANPPQRVTKRPVISAPRQQAPAPTAPKQMPAPAGIMDTSPLQGFGAGGLAGGGGELFGGGGLAAPAPAPVETPTIPDVNSEETYQFQKAQLARALADYQAQNGLITGQYDTNYNDGLRKMGFGQGGFDASNQQGLYGQALNDNGNDFGARGLLHSGLYANSNSNINNQFADRKTGLDTARTQFIDTQNMGQNQFQTQNTLQDDANRREAVARIAAKYGVSLDQVPLGK